MKAPIPASSLSHLSRNFTKTAQSSLSTSHKLRLTRPTTSILRNQAFAQSRSISLPTSAIYSAGNNKNRIFDPIRDSSTFHDILLTTGGNQQVLITLWTASWCSSCKIIAPIVRELFEKEVFEFAGHGDAKGVALAPIEMDAPGVAGDLGLEFMITSIPTLLAFGPRRQEPRFTSRLQDVSKMKDREFLRTWIQQEIRKKEGGGSGGGGGGILGKLIS